MPSALHEQRLDVVMQVLRASGAASVVDLGCGEGPLLLRLLRERQFTRILGLDASPQALAAAARNLAGVPPRPDAGFDLRLGSFAEPDPALAGFEAAALVETIEHVPPDRLSAVERAVFEVCRARTIVITTPNREYNPLLKVPARRMRHPGHRFEWDRARFAAWAEGVADRTGYRVDLRPVGDAHPRLGAPSQMARFVLCGAAAPAPAA